MVGLRQEAPSPSMRMHMWTDLGLSLSPHQPLFIHLQWVW